MAKVCIQATLKPWTGPWHGANTSNSTACNSNRLVAIITIFLWFVCLNPLSARLHAVLFAVSASIAVPGDLIEQGLWHAVQLVAGCQNRLCHSWLTSRNAIASVCSHPPCCGSRCPLRQWMRPSSSTTQWCGAWQPRTTAMSRPLRCADFRRLMVVHVQVACPR